MFKGTRFDSMVEKMRDALRIVESWCERVGLTVNPDKTECILFTRKQKRNLVGLSGPTFYGKTLKLAEKVKYLGVMLDRKLNWSAQVDFMPKSF